jgi:predicted transcriptional regulator
MGRRAVDVTGAELAILQVLWAGEGASARHLIDQLYPDGGPSAAPTVHKLLERLEGKEYVRRDRSGPIQIYHAVVTKDDLIDQRLRALAEELCDGSLGTLVSHLVDARRLKPSARAALREYVEELDKPPSKNNRKR